MKTKIGPLTSLSLLTLALTGLLFLAGCATTNRPELLLDPVGPPPGQSANGNASGTLIVFSAFTVHGVGGMDRPVHSRYRILAPDGALLQEIHNDPGNMIGGPTRVSLDPGKYIVQAKANGYRIVKVPVVIAGGKTTVVHLEGGGSWPDREKMIQAGAVRLPDGRVVGWAASLTTTNR